MQKLTPTVPVNILHTLQNWKIKMTCFIDVGTYYVSKVCNKIANMTELFFTTVTLNIQSNNL